MWSLLGVAGVSGVKVDPEAAPNLCSAAARRKTLGVAAHRGTPKFFQRRAAKNFRWRAAVWRRFPDFFS